MQYRIRYQIIQCVAHITALPILRVFQQQGITATNCNSSKIKYFLISFHNMFAYANLIEYYFI